MQDNKRNYNECIPHANRCRNKKEYMQNSMFHTSYPCNEVDVFNYWSKSVNEQKGSSIVSELRKYYEISMWSQPAPLKEAAVQAIQYFYHGKYCLFTCFDSESYKGQIELDPDIFNSWDNSYESLKHTWYLSVAYALSVGALTFEDLEPYKVSYQDSKAYRQYLKSHPNHQQELTKLRSEQLKSELCDSEEVLKQRRV